MFWNFEIILKRVIFFFKWKFDLRYENIKYRFEKIKRNNLKFEYLKKKKDLIREI